MNYLTILFSNATYVTRHNLKLIDIIVKCFVCRLIYICTIALLRFMQIKWSQHYVFKYVHMYNFLSFCYIITEIVLSGSPITQDAHTFYCVFGKVYECTKYIGMIAVSM